MSQHFLLSKEARTLSLGSVLRLTDDEAYAAFKAIRFAETEGEPVCPKCGCLKVYEFTSRKILEYSGCKAQFTLTSGTIFASRKLAIRDILAAIAIFMNGAKGHSAPSQEPAPATRLIAARPVATPPSSERPSERNSSTAC